MTVYTGSTFQTCALKVWGLWVSMRDLNPDYTQKRGRRDMFEGFRTRRESGATAVKV